MQPVRKTVDAERDIDSIADRISRDSVDAALRWLVKLQETFDLISRVPGIGTSHNRFRKGLRSTAFGQYLIFFRKAPGGVQILRVIHGDRKWQRLLKQMDD